MDIIKFDPVVAPTRLERGEIVNGFKSKMWIERYSDAGEFTLTAKVKTGMKKKLPIGTLISHLQSTDVMIVEDHNIKEEEGEEPEIIITGRGFPSFLDQRIVGSNKEFPVTNGKFQITLDADYVANQVVTLIQDHIYVGGLVDAGDAIPNVTVETDTLMIGVEDEREIEPGSLYSSVLDLMKIEDLGLRVYRPGPWSPLGAGSPNIALIVHNGVNKSSNIVFSEETGEIKNAEYLWSSKKRKNTAFVTGRWVATIVETVASTYERRMMHVDASDIDNELEHKPTDPGDISDIVAKLQKRGLKALAAQKDVDLIRAELSQYADQSFYRKNFNIGDIVMVHGNYNEKTLMRISEYVEIEDEEGTQGYPVLSVLGNEVE